MTDDEEGPTRVRIYVDVKNLVHAERLYSAIDEAVREEGRDATWDSDELSEYIEKHGGRLRP